MTVGELKKELDNYPVDEEVKLVQYDVFSQPYLTKILDISRPESRGPVMIE